MGKEKTTFGTDDLKNIKERIDSAFGKYISVKDIKAANVVNNEAEIIVTLSYMNDDEFLLSEPGTSLRKLIKKGHKIGDEEIVIKDNPSHLKMDFRTYDDKLSFSLSYRQLRKLRGIINEILGKELNGK